MTSSTSSSDAREWRGFVAAFLAWGTALTVTLAAGVMLLDPFDRGAFGGSWRGIAEGAPRVANASRARDPAFDSAVLGNSHIQLVDPAALSRVTGLAFVSLTVPGTGPREQLAILDAFLRHHRGTGRALVLGLDPAWCTEDEALPLTNPFPFWLYDPSRLAYLRGLLRYTALEQAVRHVGFRLGWAKPARRDGYWNYAQGRAPGPLPPAAAPAATPAADLIAVTRRFPGLDLLGQRLRRLPAAVAVVLLRPPVHVSALPVPGSTLARAEEACRAAEGALLPLHAASVLVDLRRDGPEARDAGLWFDDSHYAEPVARMLETTISTTIASLGR